MIGYYVHHHGKGHLHRARALTECWRRAGTAVTVLSSLTRPEDWHGPWVQLPRDDLGPHPVDAGAGGQLHWVPLGDSGIRTRAAALSAWVEEARPSVVVVDVSVETALLVRLHGVPVVTVVQPGHRTDAPHLAGYRASSALVACWPETWAEADLDLTPGLPDDVRGRIERVGAISRLDVRPHVAAPRDRGARHAVLLQGRGGDALWQGPVDRLARRTPGWTWTVLGGEAPWVDDPSTLLSGADVVVATAGQGSIADVAALRRPMVVVPSPRPYDEQQVTATALDGGPWPVVVVADPADAFRSEVLDEAAELDGAGWGSWCDGGATDRFRRVVEAAAFPVGHVAEDGSP